MKTRTKTSLKITMEPEGGATTNLKWSDKDIEYKEKTSVMLIRELVRIPDYEWLAKLTFPYFREKYCQNCKHRLDMNSPCRDEKNKGTTSFPFCAVETVE
jgi:hypothetical protein